MVVELQCEGIALIQARGMPIDMPLWNLVQENKTAVIAELLRQLDPSSGSNDPIYNAAGEWDYRRFERWLISTGVAAWPRLESGRLDVDGDAFRLMYHVPGIEGLHALRDSLRVIIQQSCRSDATAGTGRACSRSAPPRGATRTAGAYTMRTPECAALCCSRPTSTAFIWIGVRRKLVSLAPSPAIRR